MSNGPGVYEGYNEHFCLFQVPQDVQANGLEQVRGITTYSVQRLSRLHPQLQSTLSTVWPANAKHGKGFRPPQQKEVKQWLELKRKPSRCQILWLSLVTIERLNMRIKKWP
jgi:hypothetical protein